jgi:predicted dehydrogenase
MGSHHLRILRDLKGVELVGLFDADPARARDAADTYGCRFFDSVAAMADEVDAACVATPSVRHADVAGELLERGVHCLVEKPLATNEADCLALIDAAARGNLVLLVGHVERFNPVVQQLGRILAGSTIHAVDVRRMSALSARVADVDVVADLMIHDIDVVLGLVGAEVTGVAAQGVRTAASDGQDYVTAALTFETGAVATLTASRITHNKVRKLDVTADVGFVTADYGTQELLIHRQGGTSMLDSNEGADATFVLDLAVERVLVRAEEPLAVEIRHFVDAARGRSDPRVSGRDALRALQLAWRIQALVAESAPHRDA